jgi:hypothetical protein
MTPRKWVRPLGRAFVSPAPGCPTFGGTRSECLHRAPFRLYRRLGEEIVNRNFLVVARR